MASQLVSVEFSRIQVCLLISGGQARLSLLVMARGQRKELNEWRRGDAIIRGTCKSPPQFSSIYFLNCEKKYQNGPRNVKTASLFSWQSETSQIESEWNIVDIISHNKTISTKVDLWIITKPLKFNWPLNYSKQTLYGPNGHQLSIILFDVHIYLLQQVNYIVCLIRRWSNPTGLRSNGSFNPKQYFYLHVNNSINIVAPVQ